MDELARMNQNAGPYAGLDRYEARERIVKDLEAQGLIVGTKDYTIALGKCERCGTVVEPRLSAQSFVKIRPLAEHGIEVVENGAVSMVPENYNQVYLNWTRYITEWVIPRTLW